MIPILKLGTFEIPTFFLVISLSLSALLFFLSYRVDAFGKPRKIAFDLALILMIGGFIGGRLFHIFYEEWDYYAQNPLQMFYFWQGGFVYFGGFLIAWPAAWIYCKKKKFQFLEWADFFAPLLSLSHALGRIGCMLTGCCYGVNCELPWAVAGRHPTQWYLFLGEIAIFGVLLILEKRNSSSPLGHLFFKWIFLHSLLRYFVEFFRADDRGEYLQIFGLGSISASQAICLVLMFVALFGFVGMKRTSI